MHRHKYGPDDCCEGSARQEQCGGSFNIVLSIHIELRESPYQAKIAALRCVRRATEQHREGEGGAMVLDKGGGKDEVLMAN